MMERVLDGKQDEVKASLNESFSIQPNGTFNVEYLGSFVPKILAMLKPERIEEVKTVMNQYGTGESKS
ncbi:MAG: hypothetical protein P3T54_05320 [Dehalogenimonas sp.]|uniref:Uncharacterized protein n=1 Tax=Candidatus Dehalogenimonas loeffleri TaxID=3127115 RepID=A0ABZ2J274_9CHLR|nr:hypothetical protein [Dehalogenimonas sp.]